MNTFLEFFAGGGMARLGLGENWNCLFSNDIDQVKASVYRNNFQNTSELIVEDINNLSAEIIPVKADLAWGSFPCQDLSQAGNGKGLEGKRSGTYWAFLRIIQELHRQRRSPSIITLENVYGTLTSHNGKDFISIIESMNALGYKIGAVVINASHFVPQSRPRLFIICVQPELHIPTRIIRGNPDTTWHIAKLVEMYKKLPTKVQKSWIWWNIPIPQLRAQNLAELIEDNPTSINWDSLNQTRYLISLMSERNKRKLKIAKLAGKRVIGTLYRRTRKDKFGKKHQRAEVRFDGIAGCLRTPSGGSSRQTILIVEGEKIRSRLLSSRETARLMGLPESYILPQEYNSAYYVTGDGVVVPVVRYLASNIIEPILIENKSSGDEIKTNEKENISQYIQLQVGQCVETAI